MLKKIALSAINDFLILVSIMILMFISGFLTDNLIKFCLLAGVGGRISIAAMGIVFICLSLGFRSIILFFMIAACWLYFRKREIFPKILIVWLCIAAAGLLVYIIQILQIGPIWRFLIKIHPAYSITAFIFSILWGLYLKKSKRARKEFIYKLTKPDIVFFAVIFFLIFVFAAGQFCCDRDNVKRLFAFEKSSP